MIYDHFIRPFLFIADPEDAHDFVIGWLKQSGFLLKTFQPLFVVKDARLRVTLHGMDFPNPVGLAAGFDKNAEVVHALPNLGFGFIELGTVTPLEQVGNPRPRMFRLAEDSGLINRMGFNNPGAMKFRWRLERFIAERKFPKIPVGVNIGKGKETPLEVATGDYLYLFETLYDFGNYFVINVSSPNTPNLRKLQDEGFLTDLVSTLQAKNEALAADRNILPKPMFVKIAPDLTFPQIDTIIQIVINHNLSGIIATNTTISREGLRSSIQQAGGLSGKPLRKKASEVIGYIYRRTEGSLPIIGVGGIFSAEDAYEKITLGASLVQLYTGFIYKGPFIVKDINLGLLRLMGRDGFKSIQEAVGAKNR
jgi:dihydroorotate dehydrogenase